MIATAVYRSGALIFCFSRLADVDDLGLWMGDGRTSGNSPQMGLSCCSKVVWCIVMLILASSWTRIGLRGQSGIDDRVEGV